MGQSVAALMYGISRTTPDLFDDEGEPFWDSNKTAGKRLDWDEAPRVAYEGEVVGFPVACSSGAEDDEGDLGKDCLLSEIEQVHAEYITAARKKWDEFAAWALKEHGKVLPPAALWLTTDERA